MIKLLHLEDNPPDQKMLRILLQEVEEGAYDLTQVDTLEEALKLLREIEFQAVLTDLRLPDSQGLETLQQVKMVVPDVPIIVVSGTADEDMAYQAVSQGAQDFLFKGQFDARDLVRSIGFSIGRQAQIAVHLALKQVTHTVGLATNEMEKLRTETNPVLALKQATKAVEELNDKATNQSKSGQ